MPDLNTDTRKFHNPTSRKRYFVEVYGLYEICLTFRKARPIFR